jgi:hypothetical protein
MLGLSTQEKQSNKKQLLEVLITFLHPLFAKDFIEFGI